jgi:hypothetical protein
MALLADEELMFIKPKIETDKSNMLEPFGYYVDERGIRRKGRIPKPQHIQYDASLWQYYYENNSGIRTSDPRYNF